MRGVGNRTDRTDAKVGSILAPVQGGVQGMDRIFHTADRKGQVDLDVTREPPSFANTAPNRAKCRTRNPSIDGVGKLPWNLGQTEPGIQNCVQATPSVNN